MWEMSWFKGKPLAPGTILRRSSSFIDRLTRPSGYTGCYRLCQGLMLPGVGEGLGGFFSLPSVLPRNPCHSLGRTGGCHFLPEKPAFHCAFLSTRPVPPTETVPIALVPQEGWEKAV